MYCSWSLIARVLLTISPRLFHSLPQAEQREASQRRATEAQEAKAATLQEQLERAVEQRRRDVDGAEAARREAEAGRRAAERAANEAKVRGLGKWVGALVWHSILVRESPELFAWLAR